MTDLPVPLGFGQGLKAVPRSFGILFRAPRILLWLMPPLLITLLLDGLAFYFAFDWIHGGLGAHLPAGGYFGWLRPVLDVLGALAVIFVLGWSFAWLFLALTSPFQDFISAAVEKEVRGVAGPDPAGLTGIFRSLALSLLQVLVLSVLTLFFLLFGLVPVVGPVVFFVWSALVLGYSFVAIPAGRMAHGIGNRLSFARHHLRAVLGLGSVVAVASLVPLVNVLLMPVFVVAGTLLYLEATHPAPAPALPTDNGHGPA